MLARRVLAGKTTGYRNHPQLKRFKAAPDPVSAIDAYLTVVLHEAARRVYNFDASKIWKQRSRFKIAVTRGQTTYELMHLKRNLQKRNRDIYLRLEKIDVPKPHPLFRVVNGPIEDWEKPRFDS